MKQNTPKGAKAPNGAQRERKLNVILHGLFTFVEGQDKDGNPEIQAYVPNMGSEHVYTAGTWLAETTLQEHVDLTLHGVERGTATFESQKDKNLVLRPPVRVCDCGCEEHTLYAIIRFPLPLKIESLQTLTIPKDSLAGADIGKVDGLTSRGKVQNATVQVLTYRIKSDAELAEVRLGDDPSESHPWQPVLEHFPEGDYVNLHIFSGPERSPNGDHIRHAFQAGVSVFAGLDITLRGPAQPGDMDAQAQASNIPGVDSRELEDLIYRRRRLGLLGRAIKQKRDLNSIWDDPVVPFYGNDACLSSVIYRSGGSIKP